MHEEDVRKFIEAKGGMVQDSWKYVNAKIKFEVTCSLGHSWFTCWDKINQGRWCPECAGHVVHAEDIKNLIDSKGWHLFDKNWKYKNAWDKIEIVCSKDHYFKISTHDMKRNVGCAECKNLKVHEKNIKIFIENKGGVLKPDWVYKNNREKIEITCSKGHTWKTSWKILGKEFWCPYCSGHSTQESDIKKFIEDKGGILERDWRYINCETKFWVICKEGHKFKTCWDHIKQNHWCHYCNASHGEKDFRDVIEKFFHEKFEKLRPIWLKSNVNGRMELDGYNEGLSIAFEYQGQQHYSREWFRISEEDFKKQKERDQLKKEICEKRAVKLIIVPYYHPKSKWIELIKESLK